MLNEYDDIKPVQADSPMVDKMREYVDLQRENEHRESETHRLEKQSAEASARMSQIRRELVGYLEPERAEAMPSRGDY